MSGSELGEKTMVHAIEFRWVVLAQVDRPEYSDQQQVVIKKGTRLHTHIKPYVVESHDGPLEVADLYLDDGSVARAVRFAAFQFLDSAESRKA
jgi:hypothetical protein